MKKLLFASLMATSLSVFAQDQTPTTPTTPDKPIINPTLIRNFDAARAVPHTSVKDQGYVGFCWAYSGMGLIESEFLKRTGQELDLNEEFIGFHHIYEQILTNADTYYRNSKLTYQRTGRGWRDFKGKTKTGLKNIMRDLNINFFFKASEGAPNLQLVMDLAQKYGVVPEENFKYKITKEQQESVAARIMDFVNSKLRDPAVNKNYFQTDAAGNVLEVNGKVQPLTDKIYNELALAFTQEENGNNNDGNCDSCDLISLKNGFYFNGQRFTPKQFLEQKLQVNLANFHERKVNAQNFNEIMNKIERSLDQNISVQVGIYLMTGYAEAVKSHGILMPENCGKYTQCAVQGGHAILIVNKTTDPQTGLMNGVIIKNSWGNFGLNENGVKAGDLGYQIVTLDYLQKVFEITKKTDSNGNTTSVEWFAHLPNSVK